MRNLLEISEQTDGSLTAMPATEKGVHGHALELLDTPKKSVADADRFIEMHRDEHSGQS